MPKAIKNFVEKVKNVLGIKPKILRSDRAKEYMGKEVQEYLSNEGIQFQCTVGYAPEQNGISERRNRTLLEGARTVLSESGLPQNFWPEAVKYTNYTFNRISTDKQKTPIELFYNRKADWNNMHSFGSEVFVMIPYERRRKLDDKAVRRVFVGYDEESKGYRIADLQRNTVNVSREVSFTNENCVFPANHSVSNNDELNQNICEEFISDREELELDWLNDAQSNDEDDVFYDAEDIQPTEVPASIPVRRSVRTLRLPEHFNDFHLYCASSGNSLVEPKTYHEAVNGPASDVWIVAMKDEIQSIEDNDTWELTSLPENRKAIGSKWVYKIKTDASGEIKQHKARLVAQGFTQKFGVDYDEVFAPVASGHFACSYQ